MAFKFEDLRVWQNALDLNFEVRQISKRFPKEERYVLTSQINRAVDSIALNIAEGSTGQTDPEFKRFLSFSIRSGIEVIGCIKIAQKNNFIDTADFDRLYKKTEELVIQIQALKKSIK